MTLSAREIADLRRSIVQLCEGQITDEEGSQLKSWLADNEESRRIFAGYNALVALLELEIPTLACDECGIMNDECMEGRTGEQHSLDIHAVDSRPSAAPFPLLTTTLSSTVGWFSPGWPVAYLVATLIFGLGLLIGSHTYVSQPAQVARQSSMPSRVEAQPKMELVGRITGMVDCKWAGAAFDSPAVPLGRKYELASGLMEITYDTGAKVILQGPVTYEVESGKGGYLAVGKLTGKLEKNDKRGTLNAERSDSGSSFIAHRSSFAVRTPTAIVTDLGTEFGVEVNSEGATDTQVFVGKVQIATAGSQRGGNGQTRVIRAGQYAHLGKDMMLSADDRDFEVRAKRFTRIMPAGLPTSDAYAELVLSMNPVVYYRMDQWPETDKKGRYVLVDSAPGAHHGVACLDRAFGKPSCRGKFGGAMDLHGQMGSDYAFVKNYPKADNGQLSVSAWVWPVVLDPWVGIVSNWYSSSAPGEIGQFGFGVDDALELSALIHQQDGGVVRVWERGKPLPRSQWHHVAFVADGAVLHLYRNGVEIGAAPCHGIACQPLPECLSIGCATNKDGTGPRPENAYAWNGRLDEIAVFNHALSAEQVRQLYAGEATAASRRTSP